MPNHVAVNPRDHKDLRVLETRSDEMGDGMMCCITFPEEFRSLQNHYPILFQLNQETNEYMCLVVFGFENSENLFLKNDKWDARYIPLAMDIQPFMIGKSAEHDGERKVVVDLDSPRLGNGEGRRIFTEEGAPTIYLENVSKKLAYLDEGFSNSGAYIKCLQKYDLLEALSIDVTLKDGSKNRLVGFFTINEDRFRQLSPEALAELQEEGYLMPSFMLLASLSNLGALIHRKNDLFVDV